MSHTSFSTSLANAAARCTLIGQELWRRRAGATLVTQGGSPARAPVAGAVSGPSKPGRVRHAEP